MKLDLKISQENESRNISDELDVRRREGEWEPRGKLARWDRARGRVRTEII